MKEEIKVQCNRCCGSGWDLKLEPSSWGEPDLFRHECPICRGLGYEIIFRDN